MNLTQKPSEQLAWHLVYSKLPGIFFILDTNLKILAVSRDMLSLLQRSEDEVKGKTLFDIYAFYDDEAEADDLKWRLSLEYMIYTGKPHRMNIRKLNLRGQAGNKMEKFFRPLSTPVYDEDELLYVIHQLEEVKPQKNAQEDAHGFDIISIINDGIYEINFKTKGVRWNDQLFNMLGYGLGEIDLDLPKMLRTIHSDDRRRVRDLIKTQKHSTKGFKLEFRLKKKSGDFVHVLSKGMITRNKEGEPLKLTATIHDVSNYKEQERLKTQLELITNTLPVMIFYIDHDLKYQYVNRMLKRQYGKPLDDILGHHVSEVLNDAAYQKFLPKALKALEGEKIEVEETTTIDGRSRFNKTWYLPDIHVSGIRGFVGLTMDVTEERMRESALKMATEEKQQLLDQLARAHQQISKDKDLLKDFFMDAPAIIAIHEGPQYIIKYLNKNAINLYGDWIDTPFRNITSAAVYENIVKVFNDVYYNRREFSSREFKVTTSMIQGRPVKSLKREVFFDLVVQPILNDDGKAKGIILYANDVTDLVHAKRAMEANAEKNRLLLEAMPTITCTYDAQGKIEYVNSKWYEYTGQSTDTPLEEGVKSALHPDDVLKNDVVWSHCLTNECMYDEYLRIKDRFGNYKWHHHRVVPIKGEQNKVSRWIGSAIDIDEEVKANEKKDEFIGIASHELKTPLTSVKAYIQLAQSALDEEQKDLITSFLHKAYKNTDKLHDLISELLDVSRIQSGKMELNIQQFDLDDMVKECVESYQFSTHTHDIRITGKTGVLIDGDKERLEQILNNLLSNAIKYSPGKDKVIVSLSRTENHVLINVTDFGPGIAGNEQRKLFEQFYRAKDVSRNASGLGIGLYISLAIAKIHKGHISVRSEVGKGSTFTLILPITATKA